MSFSIPSVDLFFDSETFRQYGNQLLHGINKLYEAEMTGNLYQAVPLAIGAYVGATAVPRLQTALFGYDSAAFKQKFRQKAYEDASLSYSERLNYLSQGIFGSMSSRARALILADAVARIVVAGFIIAPFFAKDLKMSVNFDALATSEPDVSVQKLVQTAEGTDQEFVLRAYQKWYTGFTDAWGRTHAGLENLWKSTLYSSKIPQESQSFVNAIFGAPTDELSTTDSLKQKIHQFCNWTLYNTSLSQMCDRFTFERSSYPIFYSSNAGMTFVNESALELHYNATQSLIHNSTAVLSNNALAQTYAEGACHHLNNTLSYLQLTYEKIASIALGLWYNNASIAMPSSNVANRCFSLSKNPQLFSDPATEREVIFGLSKRVYDQVKLRSKANSLFAARPLEGSLPEQVEQLYATGQTLGSLDEGSIEQLYYSTPETVTEFVKNWFNISSEQNISSKVIKKAYGNISKVVNPDKCRLKVYQEISNCSKVLDVISQGINRIYQLVKDLKLSETPSRFYSPLEKANQIYEFMTS